MIKIFYNKSPKLKTGLLASSFLLLSGVGGLIHSALAMDTELDTTTGNKFSFTIKAFSNKEKALDSSLRTEDDKLGVGTLDKSASQSWKFERVTRTDGIFYRIVCPDDYANKFGGKKYLTVTNDYAKVIKYSFGDGDHQLWKVEQLGSNYRLINKASGNALSYSQNYKRGIGTSSSKITNDVSQLWQIEEKKPPYTHRPPQGQGSIAVEIGGSCNIM